MSSTVQQGAPYQKNPPACAVWGSTRAPTEGKPELQPTDTGHHLAGLQGRLANAQQVMDRPTTGRQHPDQTLPRILSPGCICAGRFGRGLDPHLRGGGRQRMAPKHLLAQLCGSQSRCGCLVQNGCTKEAMVSWAVASTPMESGSGRQGGP